MRQELREYGLLWKRPDKIPFWDPKKSGDLIDFHETVNVDKSKPAVQYLNIEKEISE